MKSSMIVTTKTAMKSFITTSLDMGVEARTIYTALKNLHTKDTDIVIDGDVYQWCIAELERQNALRNPESPLQDMEAQQLNEVKFGKEVVQNSLFACHILATGQADLKVEYLAHPHSLCEMNNSEALRVDKIERNSSKLKGDEYLESFSVESDPDSPTLESRTTLGSKNTKQVIKKSSKSAAMARASDEPAHRYLIAKGVHKPNGHVIYYIAFSSHQSLKEWNDSHTSFENGTYEYLAVKKLI